MMLRFVTILLVIAASVTARPPAAKGSKARGVETELAVYQLDPSTNKDVLLYCDTTTLVDSMRTTGFLVANCSTCRSIRRRRRFWHR